MKEKKGSVLLFLILLGLLWALTPALAAEKNEIILGYSAPVSGGMSHIGEKIRHGYTIWSEMVNEKGGIFVKEFGKKLRVKLVMYDDKSDPTTSAKLYEKLISQDRVDLVLSPYGSSIGFPVSAICQKYKMPIVFVWVSSGPIYKQGYDYAFCLIEPSERHLWTPVRSLKDTRIVSDPPKKLIFIASKELYDITAAKGGIDLAKELGFETYYEEVEKGVKDFTPIISRAKTQGIDGLIAALYPAEFFLLFRQMQELGYRPKYINGLHGPDLPDFWDTFGKTANGVVTGGYYSSKWPSFENKEYVERYQKKWNEIPTHYGATGAGGQVLHQAIEKAGTLNPEKVREVLLRDEFKCVLYPRVKFVSEAGYTNINKYAFTGVLQWEEGKLLTVFPPELAEAKLKYPLPSKW